MRLEKPGIRAPEYPVWTTNPGVPRAEPAAAQALCPGGEKETEFRLSRSLRLRDDCLQDYSYLFSPDILKPLWILGWTEPVGEILDEDVNWEEDPEAEDDMEVRDAGSQKLFSTPEEASQSQQSDLGEVQTGEEAPGGSVGQAANQTGASPSSSPPPPPQAAKKLEAATGQRCLPLSLDVRQPQTILAAVDEAVKEFERIDILINNAAGNFLCPASALSFNAYKTVIDIDTLGTFNVSKVLYEKCLRDHGGVIVNITATLSYRGQALQVHAGTAKAAVDAMTRHLAVEWGPNNIRVNSLAPGPIAGTEGYRRLGGARAEADSYFDTVPLHRAGNKTEIAHSVLYLASPLASYVTGTTLVVDGGSWLTSPNNFPALLDGYDTDTINPVGTADLYHGIDSEC
ncbi:Peroxisomal 2,4-dienoyl-CoA reductase [Chelonia mydas]|uniref:Peroxisomal 2,4-dienoyl-CoA reductase [(3E)-enoyl-CoA-producing] n=1 Tax=Chelonia mydas TaxID=8469 RepID=M7C8C5_CHEMY|nr:Peroxisomal 2,4-dienoyl-CoA reductase [Chelonia mydas]